MKILAMMFIVIITGISSSCRKEDRAALKPPMTVGHVDLKRYAGNWYEISKIPNRFQRVCAGNTTAQYSIWEDGRIDIVNRCIKADGSLEEARGIARVVDATTNAKLKVSFVYFLRRWWFWGDYWIVGLGNDYDYAIVGAPDRRYGWILSRDPDMDPGKYSKITTELKNLGYNPEDFERTRQ
jgi:apolipoprotein D and lipocalin family protein